MESKPDTNCVFTIVQKLPAGIFVNLDQLSDLSRFGRINFHSKFVDVELPTSKSKPSDIYLFGKLKSYNVFTLPIHFRYQSPGERK